MRNWIRPLILACLDATVAAASLWLALYLRFEGRIPSLYSSQLAIGIPVFIIARLGVLWLFGIYRSLWRYAGPQELVRAMLAVFSGSALVYLVDRLTPILSLPRSVYAIELLLFILGAGLVRLAARWRRTWLQRGHAPQRKRVLIVGAGDAGAMLVREFQSQPQLGVDIVGLIDDDVSKLYRRLNGVRVVGRREDIGAVVKFHRVDEIIIAMPSVKQSVIQETINICKQTGAQLRILPPLEERVIKHIRVQDLRKVQIEDLLRREPIRTDLSLISGYLKGKRVLITGAGGSIGSELCRQVCTFNPEELVLLGHGENSIFEIERQLRDQFRDVRVVPVIADIRDRQRIEQVFARHRPHVVFHAAAHKHVPLMEANPEEAITNNVFGTRNVAQAAARFEAERFVMVSTDKAVNPANVMGATKRLAEMVVQAMQARGGKTRFVSVRFGNVLGSRGSVVPIFQKQIEQGGPVTVTHPDMRRYFMTIPEAVQLVIQAGAMGQGGEVFILDMGEPVRIDDLARDLIRLAGYEPDKDIRIVYTGVRPGEKLFEELVNDGEAVRPTSHEKILALNGQLADPATVESILKRLELLLANDSSAKAAVRFLYDQVGGHGRPVEAGEQAAGATPNSLVSTALQEIAVTQDDRVNNNERLGRDIGCARWPG